MNWAEEFSAQLAASERRASESPSGLADEIEHLREKYGAGDHAWVDIVEKNLDTILRCLRSPTSSQEAGR